MPGNPKLSWKQSAFSAGLVSALLITGAAYFLDQSSPAAAQQNRHGENTGRNAKAASAVTIKAETPATDTQQTPSHPVAATPWTEGLCAEYRQWSGLGYNAQPSHALLDALRRQIPAVNIDRQTLALAFASFREIGVAAARVVVIGGSDPEAGWRDSAYGHYSAGQLRAMVANGDSEAMRVLGLQQLRKAWSQDANGLRLASLAHWQDGVEWLSQSVARGNRQALYDLLDNSLIAASIGTRKDFPEATQLKRDYLLWNHMATRIGTAAQVLNGAGNLRYADVVAPALKAKLQMTAEDEQWLQGRFADLAHLPQLDTLSVQTRHALISLAQSEAWIAPAQGACGSE